MKFFQAIDGLRIVVAMLEFVLAYLEVGVSSVWSLVG
jgi:hypothetical protein